MSRLIYIGYRQAEDAESQDIEIQPPYYLFGTPTSSKLFWSLPIWQRIGVRQLSELGTTDPIHFVDWESVGQLGAEIDHFRKHVQEIDYDPHLKSTWLAHLIYCHSLLVTAAPSNSIPEFTIG